MQKRCIIVHLFVFNRFLVWNQKLNFNTDLFEENKNAE